MFILWPVVDTRNSENNFSDFQSYNYIIKAQILYNLFLDNKYIFLNKKATPLQ